MEAGSRKRKAGSIEPDIPNKRATIHNGGSVQVPSMRDESDPGVNLSSGEEVAEVERERGKKKDKRRADNAGLDDASPAPAVKYRKLAPPRPFPTVPTSSSATGPRSAHTEGKNYICITRKTPLGMYLARCKDAVLKDGHKTLHLSALGAAIPHLLQLALSLPDILPYAPEEIQTEVLTGTVELHDEVIPDDEDEDISIQTRGKSSLQVIIKIGDGVDEGSRTGKGRQKQTKPGEGSKGKRSANNQRKGHEQRKNTHAKPNQVPANPSGANTIVVREEDMDDP